MSNEKKWWDEEKEYKKLCYLLQLGEHIGHCPVVMGKSMGCDCKRGHELIKQIFKDTRLQAIEDCRKIAIDTMVETRILEDGIPVETYGYEEEYNKACHDISTALSVLKK